MIIGLYKKRHMFYYMGVLLQLGVKLKQMRFAKDEKYSEPVYYIKVPDTRVTRAAWLGYVAGRKLGYIFGVLPPGMKWGKEFML